MACVDLFRGLKLTDCFGFFQFNKTFNRYQKILHAASTPKPSAVNSSSPETQQNSTLLGRLAEIGTMLFPVWALLSGGIAFFHPPSLNWMTPTQFEQGVGILMLSMGLSLSMDDFKKVD